MLGPIQTLWVDALESGNYLQNHDALMEINGTYCCLGVARVLTCGRNPDDSPYCFYEYEKLKLRSFLGDLKVPYEKDGLKFNTLSAMNDGVCLGESDPIITFTFKEIAAYIRANPENVFTGAV